MVGGGGVRAGNQVPDNIYESRNDRARRVDLDPASRRPLGKYISARRPAPIIINERVRGRI